MFSNFLQTHLAPDPGPPPPLLPPAAAAAAAVVAARPALPTAVGADAYVDSVCVDTRHRGRSCGEGVGIRSSKSVDV